MFGARGMKRGRWLFAAIAVSALAFLVNMATADPPNERHVKPGANAQDKDDITKPDSKIWVLDFRFKDPRLVTVDVPGRGRKVCWYLWYQVINKTNEPHTFIPDFDIVTQDKVNKPVHDQILPRVEEAIRQIEDPTNFYKIKNSVTIASEPIPRAREDAVPVPVTGVAIWDDVDPETNAFSIFVSGLSNGWSIDDNKVVRRKTLQLNYKRPGDKFFQDSKEIRFIGPPVWIYRASEVTEKN